MPKFTWKFPTNGDWGTAANWTPGAVPGNLDTAIIDQDATYTVTSVDDRTVRAVSVLDETATLAIARSTFATRKLVNDGSVSVAGGPDDAGTLAIDYGIVNTGMIAVLGVANEAATLQVGDGPVRLTGGGTVVLNTSVSEASITSSGAASSLINVDNTIEGAGAIRAGVGVLGFNNRAAGVIDASVIGETLLIDLGTLGTNSGIMRASKGILEIQGDWRFNDGVLDAVEGIVLLDQAVIGGRISLQSWPTGAVSLGSGLTTLSGIITNSGNLVVDGDANAANTMLMVEQSLTNSGTITVRGGAGVGQLQIGDGTLRLDGAGTVALDGTISDAQIVGTTGDSTLVNVDNLIRGAGSLGNDSLAIVNGAAGVISADVAGETLLIDPGTFSFINYGELNASDGGRLVLRSFIKSIGPDATISADGTSSTVVLENAILTGTYRLDAEPGSAIVVAEGFSALAGNVTIDGAVIVDAVANGGVTQLNLGDGTITNNGTITVTGAEDDGSPNPMLAYLTIDQKVVLQGGGSITIEGSDEPFNGIFGLTPDSLLYNVDNTIEGSGGIIARMFNGAAGVIDANIAGETLYASVDATNAGTFQASNGGTLTIGGLMNFEAGGIIKATGDDSLVVLDNLFMIGEGKIQTVLDGSVAVTGFNAVYGSLTVEGTLAVDANLFDTGPAFDFDSLLVIEGHLINIGVINVAGYDDTCGCPVLGALLIGDRGASFSGGGTIVLGGDPGTALIEEQFLDFRSLTNVDNHIEGTGAIGAGFLFLRNGTDGIIEANVDGEALVIDTGDNTISNRGTLMASDGGLLTVASDVRGGSGIVDDARLEFQGASSAAVSFTSGEAVLELDQSGLFSGTIAGLDQSSDYAIDLTDIDFATVSASFRQYDGRGVLSITDGTDSARLKLFGEFEDNVFTGPPPIGSTGFLLSDDGFGGTTVTYI